MSDLRKHSVCGTGVAEKRRLGDASKAKIETLVAIGAQHPDAFGPRASPGVRECADSVQGALYHSGSFENRGARMDYAANDRSSIARLGVGAEGVPDSHPAKPALAHLAPAARPLREPRVVGPSRAKNERPCRERSLERDQGGGGESGGGAPARREAKARARDLRLRDRGAEEREPPRWDTDAFYFDSALDAAALEARARGGDAIVAKAAAGRGRRRRPGGSSGRPAGAGTWRRGGGGGDGDGDRSVALADGRAAGDAVRTLSLAERKALFEVAVQEHVAALTRQLFPQEDGAKPRVNGDIAV